MEYRQTLLLLCRPSDREAYPSEIFDMRSRLLERAAKMSKETDEDQVLLETDLFHKGHRLAIHIGPPVSCIGSAAQIEAMKQAGGSMKLELTPHREVAAFAQFGYDLDVAKQQMLSRRNQMNELLKQDQFVPMPPEVQIATLHAGVRGYFDKIPVCQIKDSEHAYLKYMHANHSSLIDDILK